MTNPISELCELNDNVHCGLDALFTMNAFIDNDGLTFLINALQEKNRQMDILLEGLKNDTN